LFEYSEKNSDLKIKLELIEAQNAQARLE